MSKNEIILVTLISLLNSGALSDTVFTYEDKNNETLCMTLINEITTSESIMDELIGTFILGDLEDQVTELKRLLGLEKDGLL